MTTETSQKRLQPVIGRAALIVSLGCVGVLLATVAVLMTPSLRSRFGPAPAAGYAVGDRIDLPSSFFDASPQTLVIFARSSCAVCQAAKASLANLVESLRSRAGVTVAMAATDGGGDAELRYGREIGLDRARVIAVAPKTLRLRTVPTVVLVDRDGTIEYLWTPPRSADDILPNVRTLTQAREIR